MEPSCLIIQQNCYLGISLGDSWLVNFGNYLDTIDKRTKAYRNTETHLIVDPLPLNLGAVHHPLAKRRGVGARHIQNLGIPSRLGGIAADAPAPTDSLVFIAEHVAVQELGALGVGCPLEDRSGLGPGDELALNGEGHIHGTERDRGEGGCQLRPIPSQECEWCSGPAYPSWVLGDELVQPSAAILLFTFFKYR